MIYVERSRSNTSDDGLHPRNSRLSSSNQDLYYLLTPPFSAMLTVRYLLRIDNLIVRGIGWPCRFVEASSHIPVIDLTNETPAEIGRLPEWSSHAGEQDRWAW
jgi:hypothetical protein